MAEEDIGERRENLFARYWSRGYVTGHHQRSNGVLLLSQILIWGLVLILNLGLVWTLMLDLILRFSDWDGGRSFLPSRQRMVDEDASLFVSRTLDTTFDAPGAFWLLFVALVFPPSCQNSRSSTCAQKIGQTLTLRFRHIMHPFECQGIPPILSGMTCLCQVHVSLSVSSRVI
jgi:hypothetical protein